MNDYINIAPGIEGAGQDDLIKISTTALEEINRTRSENSIGDEFFLRIGTRGGGCQGMNFFLGFDSEVDETDRILTSDEISILVDSKSLFYIMGITLDYTKNENGSGFVFHSPHDSKTCGCNG